MSSRRFVRFDQGDAQVHPFQSEAFDVVISRNGVMFFDDPNTAFANIARAVRAEGRLAFLCWQDAVANEWLTVPAAAALAHIPVPDLGGSGPGPFSLADRDRIRDLLSGAGFGDIDVTAVSEPLLLGRDPDDVVRFMADTGLGRGLLQSVDAATADRALAAMREALVPYQQADGVRLGSASWLVTAWHSTV